MSSSEQAAPLYYRYWGKTAEDGRYHLLPYHCLDVAAVGAVWWQRDPVIRRLFKSALGQSEDICRAWILFFLALHDLGKVDIRFQLKAQEVLCRLRPEFDLESADTDTSYYHGPYGWELFCRESAGIINDSDLVRWGEWMKAVCGHHGSLTIGVPFSLPEAEDEVITFDRKARLALIQDLEGLFLTPEGLTVSIPPPPASDLLAGFCSVCDWIGSNQFVFKPVETEMSLDKYWELALARAGDSLLQSGVVGTPLSHGGMVELYEKYQPRQVQTLVTQLPVKPGLTLIEAPTGSGKTEAALAYASRLLAAGIADSVIFALPTQATACLYGVTEAAVLAAGYAPAIGFVHTGKPLSFVYDIADIVKFDTVVPVAFKIASQEPHNPERQVRIAYCDIFRESKLLDKIIPLINSVLDAAGEKPPEAAPEAVKPAIPNKEGLGDDGHRG